jgi:15-hydroxyprostaglandin dehydrogenase (NAD)
LLFNSFAPTKIIEPIKDFVADSGSMVTVEMVIDAFMLLIEDDSYSGDIARVTAQYGVSVIGKTVAANKKAKL